MSEEDIIINRKSRDELVDKIEAAIVEHCQPIEFPIRSFFTDGLYAREMSAQAGSMIVSMIHKTEHIFVVSKGKLSVWNDEGGEVVIEAPYIGITKAGTRRFAYVHEDLVWTTFHANPDNETEDQIQERIIEKHDNPILNEMRYNYMLNNINS